MSPSIEHEQTHPLSRGSTRTEALSPDDHHNDEDDSCSVRSLPFLNYHGGIADDGKEEEDGSLLPPPSTVLPPSCCTHADSSPLERPLPILQGMHRRNRPHRRNRSMPLPLPKIMEASEEVTCDDFRVETMDLTTLENAPSVPPSPMSKRNDDISVEDFVALKVQRHRKMLIRTLASGDNCSCNTEDQETKLSLQHENVGLRQRVKQLEEEARHLRMQALKLQEFMQVKIATLTKENETLLKRNRRLRELRRLQDFKSNIRRSSAGDNPYPEADDVTEDRRSKVKSVEYVPFPEVPRRRSTGERRHSTGGERLISSISCGREANVQGSMHTKRPSLLEVLRSSFTSNKRLEGKQDMQGKLEGRATSRTTRTKEATLPTTPSPEEVQIQDQDQELWAATCDEINAQTELFNARRMAQLQRAAHQEESLNSSSEIDVAQDENRRPVMELTQSFTTLLKGLQSSFSTNSVHSGLSDEEFDVNSVLSDGISDEEEEYDQCSVHTRRTVGF